MATPVPNRNKNLSFSWPGRNKTWAFFGWVGTKSWRCEEKGNENVHLLTHAPARGVGKKCDVIEWRKARKWEEDQPQVFLLDSHGYFDPWTICVIHWLMDSFLNYKDLSIH